MKKILLFCLSIVSITSCDRIYELSTTIQDVETKAGVRCVTATYGYSISMSCNWDEWNTKTNFGEFKFSEENPIYEDEP